MERKPILRTELSLEIHLSSKQKRSVITVKDTDDAIVILESIKELTNDHLAIIYLDQNDVVLEVDTFLQGLDEFNTEHATRAIASVIYNQNSGEKFKVIIAQTVNENPATLSDYLNMKNLANFATRLLFVGVELIDCILIGETSYFSFKRDKKKWTEYKEQLKLRKELLLDEPFIPKILDKE